MQFRRGQLVKLSTRNLRIKNKKLAPRWVGPFRITEVIGRQSYRLALPAQYERLHDVFPVQMIETYHARKGQPALPMPELEDDTDEYEVEEVKDRVQKNGEIRYLVKWRGWPSEYNQWVRKDDMGNNLIEGLVRQYEKRKQKRPSEQFEDQRLRQAGITLFPLRQAAGLRGFFNEDARKTVSTDEEREDALPWEGGIVVTPHSVTGPQGPQGEATGTGPLINATARGCG